ncbi:hypothetical protein NE237_007709 [Protea cynaroides]|uniref:EF-hand domain-containing protein n=1 Tax=Protea cynaroides TaxID=273540 RepID=A0A9Q0QWQ4_9MAGN|nr:hypothetical protein NE237_007709 [Protea cynaroides]
MCPSHRTKSPSRECFAKGASDFRPAFDLLDTGKDGKIISIQTIFESTHFFFSSSSFSVNVAKEDDIGSMISQFNFFVFQFLSCGCHFEPDHKIVNDISIKGGCVSVGGYLSLGYLNDHSLMPSPCADNWVMQDMFRIMDRDGNGKVGIDDLTNYMSWVGFQASD